MQVGTDDGPLRNADEIFDDLEENDTLKIFVYNTGTDTVRFVELSVRSALERDGKGKRCVYWPRNHYRLPFSSIQPRAALGRKIGFAYRGRHPA